MTKTIGCVISVCLFATMGGDARTASAQDSTPQPGQPTQNRVWVQNRSTEAVPVSIQQLSVDAPPLRVEVIGIPTVAIGAMTGPARSGRQVWEYQSVTIPTGQNPSALLNAAGAEGWETTGVVVPVRGGTLVVVKRPQ